PPGVLRRGRRSGGVSHLNLRNDSVRSRGLTRPGRQNKRLLMPRPVILYSGQWTHLPLEELVQRASEWGYQGLELCCWGDHLEVQRALSEEDYCQAKVDLLARLDLNAPVLSNHKVGQAVCDPIDTRHQELLPDYDWGDGDPEGGRKRA